MACGALFAANYFVDSPELRVAAEALVALTDYPAAVEGADSPTIFPTVNASTGEMGGVIRPYNEYYITGTTSESGYMFECCASSLPNIPPTTTSIFGHDDRQRDE